MVGDKTKQKKSMKIMGPLASTKEHQQFSNYISKLSTNLIEKNPYDIFYNKLTKYNQTFRFFVVPGKYSYQS